MSVLRAAVRSARIVALHSGQCDITAALAIEGDDVATRRERVDLKLVVRLGEGIPLLTDADERQRETRGEHGAP